MNQDATPPPQPAAGRPRLTRIRLGRTGLTLYADDARAGRRFAAAFRAVWARIPRADRLAMSDRWAVGKAPPVILHADPIPGAGFALGAVVYAGTVGQWVRFSRHVVALMTEAVVLGLIAHELAHVRIALGDPTHAEPEADRLAGRWGFGRELRALDAWLALFALAIKAVLPNQFAVATPPSKPAVSPPPPAA